MSERYPNVSRTSPSSWTSSSHNDPWSIEVDDVLDEGYSPPERYSPLIREGEHETLDERLEEEFPSPTRMLEDQDEILDDGEVGDERAGRLVEPNEGIGPDLESDLVGTDVGSTARSQRRGGCRPHRQR